MQKTIPQIFVISLEKDKKRRASIKKELDKYQLDFNFINAVNGSLLTDKEIEKLTSKEKSIQAIGRELTKGEIGCSLSHLSIYEKILTENIKTAIILEDDATISPSFIEVVSDIKQYFSKKCQLILLGYNAFSDGNKGVDCKFHILQTSHFKIFKPLSLACCTHGYVLSQCAAKQLISITKTMYLPIDHYTGDYHLTDVCCIDSECVGVDFSHQSHIEIERISKINRKIKNKNVIKKSLSRLNKKIKKHQKCFIRTLKYLLNFHEK